MLSEEEISERNGLLIEFMNAIDLGIHIIELPHKPKFLSPDYTRQLFAYVKNFHLILTTDGKEDVFLDIRLKPLKNMNMEELRPKVLEWIAVHDHTRVYTLSLADSNLFVCGFNHMNKILKKNPYPVFAEYDPLTYYTFEQVSSTKDRFDRYDLIIK